MQRGAHPKQGCEEGLCTGPQAVLPDTRACLLAELLWVIRPLLQLLRLQPRMHLKHGATPCRSCLTMQDR